MAVEMGFIDKNDRVPARGERVAQYVEGYLRLHPGLSVGELAFRLKADKRDLNRLLNDHSCGWRLEDALAAYFGTDFVETVFVHVYSARQSIRKSELARELDEISKREAEIAASRELRNRERVVGGDLDRVGG